MAKPQIEIGPMKTPGGLVLSKDSKILYLEPYEVTGDEREKFDLANDELNRLYDSKNLWMLSFPSDGGEIVDPSFDVLYRIARNYLNGKIKSNGPYEEPEPTF